MAKQRTRRQIPEAVAVEVQFRADRTCVVCRKPGKRIQIHHIDGNHSNNDPDNLVVLCIEHHDEAEQQGGVGRKLSPGVLRRYRTEWYAAVESSWAVSRGRMEEAHTRTVNDPFELMVDAVAVYDFRKLTPAHEWRNWPSSLAKIHHLQALVSRNRYGTRVREEVLSIAYDLASYARAGMPGEIADALCSLVHAVVPIHQLYGPEFAKPSESDLQLIERAGEIGWALAYDGARWLKNLKILEAGADLLALVLRFALWNDQPELATEMRSNFDRATLHAAEESFLDGQVWLTYRRDRALAKTREAEELVPYPRAVADKVYLGQG